MELTGSDIREFLSFWQGLYQQHDLPALSHQVTEGETPTKEEIVKVLHSLPNKKAPGPDGIAAELLKKGGSTTIEMTTALVKHIWTT